MKITILADGISPFVLGGMQRHTSMLIKYFVEEGVEVSLFHCVSSEDAIPSKQDIIKELGIKIESSKNLNVFGFNWPSGLNYPGHYLAESIAFSKQLFNKFRELDMAPNWIIAKGFTGLAFFGYCRNNNIPIASHLHGLEMYQDDIDWKGFLKSRMLRLLSSKVLAKSTYLISYGAKITDLLLERGVDSTRIIENFSGVENSWIRNSVPTDNSTVNFLFLGRNERRKGIEELFIAISDIEIKNVHFHFIGPIPQPNNLSNKTNVTFHGKIIESDKLKKAIDSMDVLLCPSYSEGMPNVIMESMARGLAIVATDVGAVKLLVDASNGWFVEKGSVEDLKSVIRTILKMSKKDIDLKKSNSLKKIKEFVYPKPVHLLLNKLNTERKETH